MMTREKVLFFCSHSHGMLECEAHGVAGRLQRAMLSEGLLRRTERVVSVPASVSPGGHDWLGTCEARDVTIVRYHLTELGLERLVRPKFMKRD